MTIPTNIIYRGDCYTVLKRKFPSNAINLIYLDPPFSFDPKYARLWYDKESLKTFEEIRKGGPKHYLAWMAKRLEQCHRVLQETGSLYLHCDWKFSHDLRRELDAIFSRNNFQNEIIWWYGGGGASKQRFGRKHDTIFLYTKTNNYTFNIDAVREPYKWTQGQKRADGSQRDYTKGKIPDDVWQLPGIMPWSKQRLPYATQKPESLLERIIKASSNERDLVLDPMCGCGTTVAVAHKLNRKWIGVDISLEACNVMKQRLEQLNGITQVEIKELPATMHDLKQLGPFDFQDYICAMTNAEKTKHVADKGIDGYYLNEIPLQIKQQEGIGRNTVDNFETALRRKRKNTGYIIAFSFTRNSYEEAARARDDGLTINLIRVDELLRKDFDLEHIIRER